MNELTIKYKYHIGQVVYFMYENEMRRAIITRIHIYADAGDLERGLTKKIIDKIVSFLPGDYKFNEIGIKYSIDVVSKNGDFQGGLGKAYRESELFETQKDLIHSLSLK